MHKIRLVSLYIFFRFFVPGSEFSTFQHSVTIVGYGTDSYDWTFWKFKNSWGTTWGEDGFGKIFRGLGHCGIGSYFMKPKCGA